MGRGASCKPTTWVVSLGDWKHCLDSQYRWVCSYNSAMINQSQSSCSSFSLPQHLPNLSRVFHAASCIINTTESRDVATAMMARAAAWVQQELLVSCKCIQLGGFDWLSQYALFDSLREDNSQFHLQTAAQIFYSFIAFTKALYRLQILWLYLQTGTWKWYFSYCFLASCHQF